MEIATKNPALFIRLHPGNLDHLNVSLGGGFKHFLFLHPPGEDEPILTIIFFNWVGSTTN